MPMFHSQTAIAYNPDLVKSAAEDLRRAARVGEEEPEAVRLQRHQGRHVRRRLRDGLGLAPSAATATSSRRAPTTPRPRPTWDKALADLKEFNQNVVITPGNAGTLDMLNRGEIAMGPVWVDMFYTWKADGKLPPNMRLKLVAPGMPGQPMYYVDSGQGGATRSSPQKFIALATSPEVQAEGIVKQLQLVSGHRRARTSQGKLDQAAWKKLFADISPEDLASERQAVPDRAVLQRHPREPTRRRSRTERPIGLSAGELGRPAAPPVDLPLRHGRRAMATPLASSACCCRAGARDGRGAVPLSARLLAGRGLHAPDGGLTLAHFEKAFELYSTDILFTVFIVVVSTLLIGAGLDRHRRLC